MGNSKVILLSGVYLVLGVYTLSFNRADEANFAKALDVSTSYQIEQLANTGLALSMQRLADNLSAPEFASTTTSFNGGTVQYSADQPLGYPANWTKVVSTAQYNGRTITVTAVAHFHNNRWKVLKTHYSAVEH